MSEELDALMADFVDRLRRQESPQVEEYCQRVPALADEIRSLFPLLRNVEAARDSDNDLASANQPVFHELEQQTGPAPKGNRTPKAAPGIFGNSAVFPEGHDSEVLGDFRLLRIVGRGGMGIVYEAFQKSLGRRVALKVPAPHVVNDERLVKRFHREAQTAGMLHHTNIVPVFGVGCENGVHYLVMQFIPGCSLDRVFVQGMQAEILSEEISTLPASRAFLSTALIADMLPESESVDVQPASDRETQEVASGRNRKRIHDRRHWNRLAKIGLQVAEALDYAHRQGVLHRDIKPSNLLLDENGTIWVADFGLAKLIDNDDLTHTQDLLGTLRYLAPERFQGTCDARSDIYSLGLMLYEFALGKRAFEAANKEAVLRQIANHDFSSLRATGIDIPLDLETIILKAVARNPVDRYQTASGLVEDLQRFIEDRPIQARRLFWPERLTRWARRNPGIATLLGAVAALLIVIAIGSRMAAESLKKQRNEAFDAKTQARIAEQTATIAEAERRRELARSYLTQLRVAAVSRIQGRRFSALAAARGLTESTPVHELPKDDQPLLRDLIVRAISHADLSEVRRIPVPPTGLMSSDIDPTFEFVAEPSEIDNTTIIRHLVTGKQIHLATPVVFKPNWSDRRFSPCGRWLWEHFFPASTSDVPESIRGRVWDWRENRLALDVASSEIRGISGDGRRCFITHHDRLQSWDLLTGTMLCETAPGYDYIHSVSISSDGRYLCCKRAWHPIEVVDAETLQLVTTLGDDATLPARAFDWHPHEATIHVGRNGQINRWSLDGFEQWMPLNNLSNIVGLRHSRYGRFMAVESLEGTVTIIDMGLEQPMVEVNGQLVRISEDENHVAIRQGSEIVQYRFSTSPVLTKAFQSESFGELNPDGRLLSVSGNQGVQVWSTQPLRKLGSLGLDFCGPATWSPDGEELMTYGMFSHACRWPVVPSPDGASINIGPPSSVQINPLLAKVGAVDEVPQREGRQVVYGRNGKVIVYSDFRHGNVWQVVNDGAPEVVAKLETVHRVAISPDTRFVSGSVSSGDLTVIWDRETHQQVQRFPGMGAGQFSKDGKWFAALGANTVSLYMVGTWNRIHQWPVDVELPQICPPVFHPEEDVLAAPVSRTCVRLFNCHTGEVIVNLQYQDLGNISWLSFSGNGDVLAVTRQNLDIGLWNLPALRAELMPFGINLQHFSRTNASTESSPKLGNVNRGPYCPEPGGWWIGFQTLGRFEMLNSRWHDAIVDFDQALEITPPDATSALVNLWMLRAQCEMNLSNYEIVVANYREASRLDPSNQDVRRSIAKLRLYGPEEIRDPAEAARFLLPLSIHDDFRTSDQLDLAFALQQQGQLKSAIQQLEPFPQDGVPPLEHAMRLRLLASIHHQLGEKIAAEEYQSEFDQLCGSSPELAESPELKVIQSLTAIATGAIQN